VIHTILTNQLSLAVSTGAYIAIDTMQDMLLASAPAKSSLADAEDKKIQTMLEKFSIVTTNSAKDIFSFSNESIYGLVSASCHVIFPSEVKKLFMGIVVKVFTLSKKARSFITITPSSVPSVTKKSLNNIFTFFIRLLDIIPTMLGVLGLFVGLVFASRKLKLGLESKLVEQARASLGSYVSALKFGTIKKINNSVITSVFNESTIKKGVMEFFNRIINTPSGLDIVADSDKCLKEFFIRGV